jgi:hypothetical protein
VFNVHIKRNSNKIGYHSSNKNKRDTTLAKIHVRCVPIFLKPQRAQGLARGHCCMELCTHIHLTHLAYKTVIFQNNAYGTIVMWRLSMSPSQNAAAMTGFLQYMVYEQYL